MIKQFLETFRKPSATVIATRELEDAQRELLQAQSTREYAAGLEQYNLARITRLTKRLKANEQ